VTFSRAVPRRMHNLLTWTRTALRKNLWYVRARRHGIPNTVQRWRYGALARRTPPVTTCAIGASNIPCEVHVLTSAYDWDLAVWGIKSFYCTTGVDWPLVIHDGGGLTAESMAKLREHFPNSWVVTAQEADRLVGKKLARGGLAAVADGRARYNLMKKVIDFAVLASAPRVLLLDSDVLFFTHPAELVRLGHTETNRIVLLRDYQDSYSIDRADAQGWFGVELPECINSGLGVIPTHLVDLPFLDRVFAMNKVPLDKDGFAEQTVLGLLVGRAGATYLPDKYVVVTHPVDLANAGQVARHYVGPVKELFFDEGVPYLVKNNIVGTHA